MGPQLVHSVGDPPITRDGARAAADRELSKGIYHRYDDPWPVRVFNWVQHWIGRLFDDVSKHSPGGGAGAVAVLVAVVVLLIALRWRLGPLRRTDRMARSVLDGSTVTATAADYRRAAIAAAAEGRWSDAIIARMRALAKGLEETGELAVRPGRTADELAVEVASGRPEATASTSRAARTFDEVAYGNRSGSAEGYAAVVEADDLCSGVGSRR
jgi:HAMP domain-containing protein